MYWLFSVNILIFKPSITSKLIISVGIFLIISVINLLWIIITPVLSILVISFASIKVFIVKSESLAVNDSPSSVNSNLIPFNIGIIFLIDIAFVTYVKFSNNIFFWIANFIYFPSF